jgi:macrolide transport system ATP-binding/permease protein
MGISEARLHKMGGQKGKANLEKAIKNVEKRIEHLEIKEKPKKQEAIRLDIAHLDILHSKLVVEGKKVNKAFDDKIIFDDAEFSIYNGSKIALIGPNGCGKTTLLKMIIENEPSIKIASSVRMGYFSQDLNILDNNLTILENVMNSSIYKENFARALLARLLFKREEVHKKVDMLSGGERVKVSFAKILLQDVNLLLLDEPTNYLDIKSIEVVEDAFKEYDGTLIFVSHDRKLVSSVANHIMTIDNHKINVFKGNYAEYLESINTNQDTNKGEIQKQILVLENRLSEIIGKLSIATKKEDISAFDCEYHEVLRKLKRLKKRLRK